jgi:hypothetical protein
VLVHLHMRLEDREISCGDLKIEHVPQHNCNFNNFPMRKLPKACFPFRKVSTAHRAYDRHARTILKPPKSLGGAHCRMSRGIDLVPLKHPNFSIQILCSLECIRIIE